MLGRPSRHLVRIVLTSGIVFALGASSAPRAAELHPTTIAAFNKYATVTEAQRVAMPQFLWVEAEASRRARVEDLRRGGLIIERLETRDAGRHIDVPDGLIHHWLGAVFVPDATIAQALALLQDYDHHAEIYAPNIARSRLLSRSGDDFTLFLRFFMKKVITVVVNSDHEAHFRRLDATKAQSRIYSTRIAEIDNPDTPQEREMPVGQDGGYLWRLNSYWRLLERDGGLYLECESITLTRGIPFGLGWIVGPFVTSIPKDTLTFTLDTTRKALLSRAKAAR